MQWPPLYLNLLCVAESADKVLAREMRQLSVSVVLTYPVPTLAACVTDAMK